MGSSFAGKINNTWVNFLPESLPVLKFQMFAHAKKHRYALPAVNVIGSNSINAVMETAKAVNSPVIIQFSNGGAKFNAVKPFPWMDRNLLFWVPLLEHIT